MMYHDSIRSDIAAFVGSVLLDQGADRSPMTAASAAYTLREWVLEGVDLPDGITAPLLAAEWNRQVDDRHVECYNDEKEMEENAMNTTAEIISAGLFDAAVALMDDDIREAVHADLAPCSEEDFLTEYMRRHEEKYGTPFTVLGVPGYTEKKGDDTMENRIDMDSFGSDLPSNWEEIADYLNDIIDERGLTEHDDVNALWEAYCSGDIPGAPEPKEATTRVYGNEKTALKLSKKAQALYTDTDPLRIEEIEATDGSLSYTLTGVIERSWLSADDVNALLEEFYDVMSGIG